MNRLCNESSFDFFFFTSHRRKDLVLTKVARLGRSRCRLLGDAGQKVSLVQTLGCGTIIISITIVPGSHSSWRERSLPATSYLSLQVSKRAEITSLPLRMVRWDSLFSRAMVVTTGHSSLIPLSRWIAVMRFLGALGAYKALGMKGR